MIRCVQSPWQSVVYDLRSRCSPAGVDLVQPFQVAGYNRAIGDAFKLPDFGRSSALGVLLGNTRALWPRFLDWLRASPWRLDEDHPLERYVGEVVLQALQPLAHRWEVRFAHEPTPRRVAMQRLAHVSGLAYLSPSHLNVHFMFGPWIALRAAVVIDIDGPVRPCSEPPNPCPDCERDCLPKFRQAAAAVGSTPQAHAALEQHWRLWLAVRDACPAGREHRYSDDQIGYHYTKDRDRLNRALGAAEP
ncbi:MAG: hypothetical protein ACREYF_04150 [Gammaproteobacteria bacterium]